VSSVGDFAAVTALTLRVHDITQHSAASGAAVSAVLILGLLPLVIFAPLAGRLLDRTEIVRTLTVNALVAAAISALLAYANRLVFIYPLILLLGCSAALANPGLSTLLPEVAGMDRIVGVNAIRVAMNTGALSAGPLLAGWISASAGTRYVLLIDAVTFIVVAMALPKLTVRRRPATRHGDGSSKPSGWSFLRSDAVLRRMVVTLCSLGILVSTAGVAEVYFAKDVLRGGDFGYGLLQAAWGAGLVAGSVLIARRLSEDRLPSGVALASPVMAIAMVLASQAPVLGLAASAFAIGGTANGVVSVSASSAAQLRSPSEIRGQVLAVFGAVVTLSLLVGNAIGGLALSVMTPRQTLFASGAGGLFAVILSLRPKLSRLGVKDAPH